jgi:hypothetical protein
LKKRDGGRFSVVNAWQPPQILLNPLFSKEEVPDEERAGNDLAKFQQAPRVPFALMRKCRKKIGNA